MSQQELPSTVYHGTCVENWNDPKRCSTRELYLAADLETAKKYAAEWAEEDLTPMVLSFDMQSLSGSGVKFEPNWETFAQIKSSDPESPELTWQTCLMIYGTFCVAGDIESLKAIASEIPFADAGPLP